MESTEKTYEAVGGDTLPEPSYADVGAGTRIGAGVAFLLMVVLISLAFCCLG